MNRDYQIHQLCRKLTLKRAFFIWQLHRQEGIELPEEVRDRLYIFLDQQAKKPQHTFKYDPAGVDQHFIEQCWIALLADEIYENVENLKKQGKGTNYIFKELSRKYRESPLGLKSWQYWRDHIYYPIKHQKEV